VVKLCGLAGQLAMVSVVAAAGIGVSASAASARVRVGANNPQPGAKNVRIAFRAEARSRDSGIAFLRVRLPAGLDAKDFKLVSGPAGWRLSSTPDGYNVGGPPTDIGEDAVYQVVVDRLPNTARLAFPTVQQYSDGLIERDNPTPVLTLASRRKPAPPPPPVTKPQPPRAAPPRAEKPAAPPVERPPTDQLPAEPSTEPSSALPSESPSAEPATSTSPAADALTRTASSSRTSIWFWAAVGAAVLLAAAVAVFAWWWRRRAARRPSRAPAH